MLRITMQSTPGSLALKLEGWLTGPWVGELETCWRAATHGLAPRRVCVDLGDVCFVDDAGRELLTRMSRAGVVFATRGCVMPELVREISESGEAVRRH